MVTTCSTRPPSRTTSTRRAARAPAAFLIDSITYCGGSAPAAVGCAERPACNTNGNDNPNLWLVATADAFDSDVLAAVVAHERGHNACRQHASAAECQIMQGSIFIPGRNGCLTAAECTSYRSARTTTASGQECTCLTATGATVADATACSAGRRSVSARAGYAAMRWARPASG